jgi:hypothetical protein
MIFVDLGVPTIIIVFIQLKLILLLKKFEDFLATMSCGLVRRVELEVCPKCVSAVN